MDILTQSKEELDAQLGTPTFAQALIGGGLHAKVAGNTISAAP